MQMNKTAEMVTFYFFSNVLPMFGGYQFVCNLRAY